MDTFESLIEEMDACRSENSGTATPPSNPSATPPQDSSTASEPDENSNLFVANIGKTIDDATLHRFFEKFGKILSAKVMLDIHRGTSRGFGFVLFEKLDDAKRAREHHGTSWVVLYARHDPLSVAQSTAAAEFAGIAIRAASLETKRPRKSRWNVANPYTNNYQAGSMTQTMAAPPPPTYMCTVSQPAAPPPQYPRSTQYLPSHTAAQPHPFMMFPQGFSSDHIVQGRVVNPLPSSLYPTLVPAAATNNDSGNSNSNNNMYILLLPQGMQPPPHTL